MSDVVSVHIKKGFRVPLKGRPARSLTVLDDPDRVAVSPQAIPFIKPRLSVSERDRVKIGTPLFTDKRNPDIRFLSPGAGEIAQINWGERRAVKEIVIRLDSKEEHESFMAIAESELAEMERDRLVRAIMDGGLWPLIRELPFRDIAPPDRPPPAVLVNLENDEPFHPAADVYLQDMDRLRYGLKVLRALCPQGPVVVSVPDTQVELIKNLNGIITHRLSGSYPANDPGVLHYRIKRSDAENRAWYLQGQDLLLLVHLLESGEYPTRRIVSVGGGAAQDARHFEARIGCPLSQLAGDTPGNGLRCIVGGLFRGRGVPPQTYMGFYDTSLLILDEGDRREFLAFVRPGAGRTTHSRTFFSYFNKTPFQVDCNRHGAERACIACGYCVEACPVDILPQLTYKSILADDVEGSLEHGLLDCVECGLCSFVCPSKIELQAVFKQAKAAYYKETSAS